MNIIEYLIEKMNLDSEIVNEHVKNFSDKQDAIVRLRRAKFDEAKNYEPTQDEINEYVSNKKASQGEEGLP